MFLLDTDIISIIQMEAQPEYPRLLQRTAAHPTTAFFVSIMSFQEQTNGANAYVNRARTAVEQVRGYQHCEDVRVYYKDAQVLLFDAPAAVRFAQLRAAGVRVSTMDLRIASIALVHNFIVLTRNTNHFKRVPGLTAEDWTL